MTNRKKLFYLWPAAVLAAVILLCTVINPLCRYAYTRHFVAQRDRQLARMLAHDLDTAQITDFSKPMFFIGSGTTQTNASCLDLSGGDYDIFSVFAVEDALSLNTVESSDYIVSYLQKLGYAYTAPTEADYENYESEIFEYAPLWKAFPWYDGVMETEHCILVQLEQVPLEN